MRFRKHAEERHEEEILAVLASHMQRPGPPIVRTVAADVTPDDLHRPLVRLDEIFDLGSALIQVESDRVRAMEINVCHGRHPVPQSPVSDPMFAEPRPFSVEPSTDHAMTLRS